MGFKTYGEALTRQPNGKTYLALVGEIMDGSGVQRPTTLAGEQSKHTKVAASSVNRALSRIWSAAHWDWRLKWIGFELENQVFMYVLPDDYEWTSTGPLNSSLEYGLCHLPYEGLIAKWPALTDASVQFRSDIVAAPGGLSHLFDVLGGLTENDFYGVPEYWGIKGNNLYFFRIPDFDQMEDISKYFTFGYYTAFADLTEDGDYLPVPSQMNNIVFFLASAYFKQAFEFPDFQADEARGEGMLAKAIATHKRLYPDDAYSSFSSVPRGGGRYGV